MWYTCRPCLLFLFFQLMLQNRSAFLFFNAREIFLFDLSAVFSLIFHSAGEEVYPSYCQMIIRLSDKPLSCISLSVRLSVYQSVSSVYQSISQAAQLCFSFQSVYLSISPSVKQLSCISLSVCLSVYGSICQPD